MVQFLQAKEVTLRDLINHFQLEFIEDEHFFGEWQEDIEAISGNFGEDDGFRPIIIYW